MIYKTEAIDEILDTFELNGYHSEQSKVLNTGVAMKTMYESIIEEGELDAKGEPMAVGLYVNWTITSKQGEVTLLLFEFTAMNTGQMLNYLYSTDYHFFMNEFRQILKDKGLPF